MKIDRSILVSELADFARSGNGVVVGPPGVGKSYVLSELQEKLKKDGVPHLILPVERLGAASEAELKLVLRREGDFVRLLRSAAQESSRPAILIFDGFDAARGENERAGVLLLIRRAVTELRGQWNTIVSVRTFDAKKSQRLLELFPETKPAPDGPLGSCRQFSIPPLQEKEVHVAVQQISGLNEIYSNGTQEFRDLLKVPFNLWLIECVLRAGAKANEFSHVTSEVQLLEKYWVSRVRNASQPENREFILKKATQLMVESRRLNVRRDRIYEPQVSTAWNGLLSDEVLCEAPEGEPRVAFTHNILFDFAVSVHLLDPDPSKFAKFVAAEPSRPLFLRPSLVYHFTRLWHIDRAGFWRNFWSVVQRQEIHLRQIVRLVLPTVVVNEAQTLDDIKPLLDRLSRIEPQGAEAVAFLLQALRVLRSPKRALWAKFIRNAGAHLDYRFAWDAGTIASQIIESKETAPELRADCGHFGCDLMRWAWSSRSNTEKRQWFERLAAVVAIPMVAKTYETNPADARQLLESVLHVVGQPDFPIDCIHRLAREVEHIIPHDPDLVSNIYEMVFRYEEPSDATTHMGGHVMPMMSNRRQDYGMCRYSLIKEFPRFLARSPLPALCAGIRAVQAFAIQDHVLRYLVDGNTLDDLASEFQFRGATARYVQDGSAIWDESSYPDQEMDIADAVFTWLANAAKESRANDISKFLDRFCSEARLGFLWSRLLAVGAEHPIVMGPCLWELASAKPILEETDTLHSLGAFLERAAEFFTSEQRTVVELAILRIPKGAADDLKEAMEHRRNRLLARIPPQFLTTPDAVELRRLLEQSSNLPANTPLFTSSSSWESYTEEKVLSEQGADPNSSVNRKVRELYSLLREWSDKGKDESQIDGLIPTACAVRDLLSRGEGGDPPVASAAWEQLAGFASVALLMTKQAGSGRFQVLREIVLAAAAHPEPEPNPERDSNWKSASWSPAPRHEAAEALPWLTHFGHDEQALLAIKQLASDPVPSVRFLLACDLWRVCEHNPEFMWTLLFERATKEPNNVVLQGLTRSIWNLLWRDKAKSLSLIAKLLDRVEEDSDEEERAGANLVCMVVDYAVHENNQWAKEKLAEWRTDPLAAAASLAVAGRRLIEYITPEHTGKKLESARDLLVIQLGAVGRALAGLKQAGVTLAQEEMQRKWRSLYGVIDSSVMRIYFAADIDPNLKQRSEHPLDDAERERFFRDSLPVLETVLNFGKQPETGMLLAPTAHHFMELLNGVLRYDPPLVLRLAAEVVVCSKPFGYNLDSMAMRETVKLVEAILADYRDKIQDEPSIKNLLEVLDAFVEAGWPEALNLVWRLDEIYR